jgi:hypothetical protein
MLSRVQFFLSKLDKRDEKHKIGIHNFSLISKMAACLSEKMPPKFWPKNIYFWDLQFFSENHYFAKTFSGCILSLRYVDILKLAKTNRSLDTHNGLTEEKKLDLICGFFTFWKPN